MMISAFAQDEVIPDLQSIFTQPIETVIVMNTRWAESGLNLTIDNQWKLSIKSKQAVTISKIGLTLNNDTIANSVNLVLKPDVTAQYFFTSDDFNHKIQSVTKGYALLGIVKQISANDYLGYTDYKYKKLQVTIDYTGKDYHEVSTVFMLVMAK